MNELVQWIVGVLRNARAWVVVLPWEKAVRVRFGKHALVWDPGFHWRIPFFDDVRVVNSRLRISPTTFQALTTKDGKTVTVACSIGFRVTDPLLALRALLQPELSCGVYAMTLVSTYISTRTADQLSVEEMGRIVRDGMDGYGGGGLRYDFVSIVDFAIVRTYRLLQEGWRPTTTSDEEPRR